MRRGNRITRTLIVGAVTFGLAIFGGGTARAVAITTTLGTPTSKNLIGTWKTLAPVTINISDDLRPANAPPGVQAQLDQTCPNGIAGWVRDTLTFKITAGPSADRVSVDISADPPPEDAGEITTPCSLDEVYGFNVATTLQSIAAAAVGGPVTGTISSSGSLELTVDFPDQGVLPVGTFSVMTNTLSGTIDFSEKLHGLQGPGGATGRARSASFSLHRVVPGPAQPKPPTQPKPKPGPSPPAKPKPGGIKGATSGIKQFATTVGPPGLRQIQPPCPACLPPVCCADAKMHGTYDPTSMRLTVTWKRPRSLCFLSVQSGPSVAADGEVNGRTANLPGRGPGAQSFTGDGTYCGRTGFKVRPSMHGVFYVQIEFRGPSGDVYSRALKIDL